jgi:hypothetical protein
MIKNILKFIIVIAIFGAVIEKLSVPSSGTASKIQAENTKAVAAHEKNPSAPKVQAAPRKQSGDPLINKILADYKSNEARFHTDHKGNQLQSAGVVSKIEADPLGVGEYFTIDIDIDGSKVVCSTNDKKTASSLNKGQEIKFYGEVDDVVFGRLWLKDCVF